MESLDGSLLLMESLDGLDGVQVVARRGPGGIRHTGRFLQRRLSHHNLKHCLSTPQILIHSSPPDILRKEIGSIFLAVIREDTGGRRELSIALNIIHQLCGGWQRS